jgi:hypothetical protein
LNKSGLSFTNNCPSGPSGPGFSSSLMHARDQIIQKRGEGKKERYGEYGEKDEGKTLKIHLQAKKSRITMSKCKLTF